MDCKILHQHFGQRFGCNVGSCFMAPGRVNLIGEHTDYNGGYVFPGAVKQGIMAQINPNGSGRVRAYAIDRDYYFEFDVADLEGPQRMDGRYLYGVVREMVDKGVRVTGFDTVYTGDVPLGAGMSSSAALECCFAYGINELFNGGLDKMTLARIGQQTEHKYVGVKCGIMDQFISMHGKAESLVRLDCRSGAFEYYPWKPQGYRLLLVNSCVRHELVGSPYNERRESCERVAALAGVETLRDCTWQQLEELKPRISDEDYRRARYVLGEEERVLAVCEALKRDDYEAVGREMYRTHEGLSNDYEVSCEELDFLVEVARRCGVSGARVMGGGFGGCTINLVGDAKYDAFVSQMPKRYHERFGRDCQIIPVEIGEGAHCIE